MTTYGQNIHVSVYGGSHDPEIGVFVTGLPKGEKISLDELHEFMSRRAPGKNVYSSSRKESDLPVFLSGLTEDGITNGDKLHAVIYNKNQHSSDYSSVYDVPRPSHADFAAIMKYGNEVDLRGGGHFSGRLTAPLCIVGGICLQMLKKRGIRIAAHISSCAGIRDLCFDSVTLSETDIDRLLSNDFPTLSPESGTEIKNAIESAKVELDSVGGVVECAAIGLPHGLGEHMFSGVESRIASIVFSIPAVKGIEFGNGFACSELRGSENNDPFVTDGKNVRTKTNNAGGVLGGMTSGMPLIFRAAIKPTPSIGMCGFEHCIADAFYIDVSTFGKYQWHKYFFLFTVIIGNLLGGQLAALFFVPKKILPTFGNNKCDC